MNDTRRALRRHRRRLMIARALKSYVASTVSKEDRLEFVMRWYKHMQRCSCHMCGHRRKWCGLTRQERRQVQEKKRDEEGE
jgi:hypothetical protein